MSIVNEIQAALPRLTAEELRAVDAALGRQFRERKLGILYEDRQKASFLFAADPGHYRAEI